MPKMSKAIDVNVPVRTAYNQWTQFESFPEFMEGVEEVKQLDDSHVHWKEKIAGMTKEWDAEITDQVPDSHIAWRSTGGTQNAGAVRFQAVEPQKTRVELELDYEPEGMMEQAGEKMGIPSGRIEGDLERFKSYIEERGVEEGAWRGEIH